MAIPTITSASPLAAAPGQKVTITGTNFGTVTSVQFGGHEALFFTRQSATLIWAWVPIEGTGTIAVTNPDGTATITGFSQILTRVRLIDLPDLERDANQDDLLYIWDKIREKLCKAPVSALPAGTGTGGGTGGGDGNIYTALGSPFKVRNTSETYAYDEATNTSTITDLRLLGKADYVVHASDLSNEFENYDEATTTGNLEYDPDTGTVTIRDYKLADNRHVTIYADGILNDTLKNFLQTFQTKIDVYDKVIAPIIFKPAGSTNFKGVVWPWRRPASEIPAGWVECTDLKGKTVIGKDDTDTYDATTNPNGLSQPIWTTVGTRKITILRANLPAEGLGMFTPDVATAPNVPAPNTPARLARARSYAGQNINYEITAGGDPSNYIGVTTNMGESKILDITNPARIVLWIEFAG